MDSRSNDFRGERIPDWFLVKRRTYKATWFVASDVQRPREEIEVQQAVNPKHAEQPASDTIADADWQNEKHLENSYGQVPWCCFIAKTTNP
jgi:hypothetical protein